MIIFVLFNYAEKYGIPTSPIAFLLGKDNFIISTILNAIGTAKQVIGAAKEVIETIKSNIKKGDSIRV